MPRVMARLRPVAEEVCGALDRPPRGVWLFILAVVLLEFATPLQRQPFYYPLLGVVHLVLVGKVTLHVMAFAVVLRRTLFQKRGGDVLFLCAAWVLLWLGDIRVAGVLCIMRLVVLEAARLSSRAVGGQVVRWLVGRPHTSMMLSFAGAIGVGTLLLTTPAAMANHNVGSPLTALFTATSATCVTGLSVVDIGTSFSRFGHWVILVLIQVGGLGIMTLTSAMALFLHKRMDAHTRDAMQQLMDTDTLEDLRKAITVIALATFTLEAVGAAALYPWMEHGPSGNPLGDSDRVFYALFHAVSAYCNAGFSLYPDNLTGFVGHGPVNAVVMTLLVVGGLGVPVLLDAVALRWRLGFRLAWLHVSLHTKLALVTSGVLLAAGALAIGAMERTAGMKSLDTWAWLWASLFQSASLRTAGFNTVDVELFTRPTLLVCMLLMLVGGSPGGAAGGIKTTTLAVMALAVRAKVRGRPELEAWERSIPAAQVYQAITVVALSGGILMGLLLLLLLAEPELDFLHLVFEAVSAFATAGYSMNLTPRLGVWGQLVVTALMFAGRLGPFGLALAVGRRASPADFSYPPAKVLVG
jgi:trk system potassium uptake protein TrkH